VQSTSQLRDLDGFLLDCDGTTYLSERAYPGALQFVACLRRLGKRHLWVTNNTSRDAEGYAQKLRRLGFAATADNVYTSGRAAIDYMWARKPQPCIFPLAMPAYEAELVAAGCVLADGKAEPASVDWVLASVDLGFDWEKLRQACDLLRAGVPLLATHADKVWLTAEGTLPDCGAILAFLREATGVEAKVVGKPYPEMVRGALAKAGLEPGRAAMVGDRLYTDIRMAKEGGLFAILTLTGEATREDVESSPFQPDLVVADLAELIPLLS
jgi:HAD superfamily hydrolase (TIGR01450 family)